MNESNLDRLYDYIRTMDEDGLYFVRLALESREKELLAERIRNAIEAAREKGYAVKIDTDISMTTIDSFSDDLEVEVY